MNTQTIKLIVTILACTSLISCNKEEQPIPQEPAAQCPYPIFTAFSYKNDSYYEYLWAVEQEIPAKEDLPYFIWGDRSSYFREAYLRGEEMFVPLHNNLYICKHSNMHYSAVVLNVKEEGHDVSKIFFGKDDVLDFQPFSSFYLIRGDNLGMDYPSDPFTLQQEIDCFNALIDSGEIELYRFDLGY